MNTWDIPDEIHATVSVLLKEKDQLQARIMQLESYLDHTADGKLVCETESFYCPQCGESMRQFPAVAYCDLCPDPEDNDPNPGPLSLSYSQCLAKPKS